MDKGKHVIAAEVLNNLNTVQPEPVSNEALQIVSEVLEAMISFMNLTGNDLVSSGLIARKMMVDNIIFARELDDLRKRVG